MSPRGGPFAFDASEKGLFQRAAAVASAQLARSAGEPQRAAMNDGHHAAQLLHIRQRMRSEKDGSALRMYCTQLALELRAGLGIQTAGRFVEQVQILAAQKANRQTQLLGHSF